jgi:exocyst complex component 2
MSRIRIAMDQYGEVEESDRKQAADLASGVESLDRLEGERVRGALTSINSTVFFSSPPGIAGDRSLSSNLLRNAENAAGVEVWRLIFDLVRNLNEVIMQTLPPFWKVAKGYMEGKYQKVRPLPFPPPPFLGAHFVPSSNRKTTPPPPPPPPAVPPPNVAS